MKKDQCTDIQYTEETIMKELIQKQPNKDIQEEITEYSPSILGQNDCLSDLK